MRGELQDYERNQQEQEAPCSRKIDMQKTIQIKNRYAKKNYKLNNKHKAQFE